MGTARAPVLGSGLWPACTCLVSKPKARASSIAGISGISKPPALSPALVDAGEEIANHRGLSRLLEEERVVAVGSFDDVELHVFAVRLESVRERSRVRGFLLRTGARGRNTKGPSRSKGTYWRRTGGRTSLLDGGGSFRPRSPA